MPETCVSLTYGSTTLTIRSADFTDRRSVTRVQARSRTHDGELNVGDRELTILRFYLAWSALTDAERDAFEDFFGPTKVNGALNSFTYLDSFGDSYTVRLINDPIDYVGVFDNFWNVDLVFEQVDAEAGS